MARKPPLRHPLTPEEVHGLQSEFIARVAPESHFHLALNQLGNVRVVVKDAAGRFVWVSDNASRWHGFAEPSEMVGLDDVAINPPRLVKRYRRDDLQVLRSGRPLLGRIELAFDERGMLNWHVTNKLPLCDRSGARIGLIATIQEYPGVKNLPVFGGELKAVVEHVFAHLCEPLHVAELAAMAGVSCRQIERRFRNATGMSPTDFIIRGGLTKPAGGSATAATRSARSPSIWASMTKAPSRGCFADTSAQRPAISARCAAAASEPAVAGVAAPGRPVQERRLKFHC